MKVILLYFKHAVHSFPCRWVDFLGQLQSRKFDRLSKAGAMLNEAHVLVEITFPR